MDKTRANNLDLDQCWSKGDGGRGVNGETGDPLQETSLADVKQNPSERASLTVTVGPCRPCRVRHDSLNRVWGGCCTVASLLHPTFSGLSGTLIGVPIWTISQVSIENHSVRGQTMSRTY